MAIKADFSMTSFDEFINAMPEIVKEEVIRALSYLGEKCIIRIRDRSGDDSWFDQTGNLRSSIGYAIYQHGETVVESTFKQIANGSEGMAKGKQLIQELASKYADTYALVVLAGMEYADYVEAMKNKDVLASTELWARSEINGMLEKAKERAVKRIANLQKQLGL